MNNIKYFNEFVNEKKDDDKAFSLKDIKAFDGKTINSEEWKNIRHSKFIKSASGMSKNGKHYCNVILNDKSEIKIFLE